jgi:hypothetical protein
MRWIAVILVSGIRSIGRGDGLRSFVLGFSFEPSLEAEPHAPNRKKKSIEFATVFRPDALEM